jgi:hypothetical protein
MVPAVGDAGLLAMAVMSALLGFRSERRWLRYAGAHLTGLFPRQIGQSGYNKRLRKMIFLLMTVIADWGRTPVCGATTCGSWTRPRSGAAAPARP